MSITIFRRLRPAVNPRQEDVVLDRAREEVARVRKVLERGASISTYVYRGFCEDCGGAVVLIDGTSCEVCGSRSVVLVSKGWVGRKKLDWRDEVAA